MKWSRYVSLLFLLLALFLCTQTWIVILQRSIAFTGMDASIIGFGKPVVFHYVFIPIIVISLLINRVWSLRVAFFISAFNVAWAVRNYIVLSACSGGICPQKQAAFHWYLILSVTSMILLFFTKTPRAAR